MTPLSEKMRPKQFDEIVGQETLLDPSGVLKKSIDQKTPLSFILWGPPGCGKTSLAQLYAQAFSIRFVKMSAIFSGIGEIKKIVKEQKETPLFGRGMLLFVDEIHRFNKAQQDAFLPYIEDGTIILIGATTENPSFYLNDALLSRMRVFVMNSLNNDALKQLIGKFQSVYHDLQFSDEAQELLINHAHGDGRYLINLLENVTTATDKARLDKKEIKALLQKRPSLFDRGGDQHYNLISALHKSVRGSDPDASLYWFCRLLEGGEDPLFIARRVIRMASEDIGLADPQALPVTISALDAYRMLGSPEGELAIAEAIVYLALAPKSNKIYLAYGKAKKSAAETHQYSPPKKILNAPTKLMKSLDYGKDYIYDHDTDKGVSGQNYFPDEMEREVYYLPEERGFEREMKKRIDYFNKKRK